MARAFAYTKGTGEALSFSLSRSSSPFVASLPSVYKNFSNLCFTVRESKVFSSNKLDNKRQCVPPFTGLVNKVAFFVKERSAARVICALASDALLQQRSHLANV